MHGGIAENVIHEVPVVMMQIPILLVIGLCSSRTGKRKGMIPYRNCKLTRMFRSFFSGKGRASMIVNISQCASDFDETVQAIRFASSAMRVSILIETFLSSIMIRSTYPTKKWVLLVACS